MVRRVGMIVAILPINSGRGYYLVASNAEKVLHVDKSKISALDLVVVTPQRQVSVVRPIIARFCTFIVVRLDCTMRNGLIPRRISVKYNYFRVIISCIDRKSFLSANYSSRLDRPSH